jgi:diguanylate cyclase (GGDEF)-like protein/PAS domain S-box-containing protein
MPVRTASFILATLCILAPASQVRAQERVVRPIAEAKAREGTSDVVTIAGRVSAGSRTLQSNVFDIAVQDATGGLRVFSRTARATVALGDSVIATGQLKRYRGDLELVVTDIRLVSSALRAVRPREIPIDATLIQRYPGQLVRIEGRVTRTGVSEGGQWLHLIGANGTRRDSLTLWVPANHAASTSLSAIQPQDSLVATGIVTPYQDNAEDPITWQIVPRDSADIMLAEGTRPPSTWLGWAGIMSVLALTAALVIGRLTAHRQLSALRETETRYRQLLALSPDAVIVHVRGLIRFANPAAALLLGAASEKALVGQPLADYLPADSRETFEAMDERSASPGAADATRLRAQLLVTGGGTADVEITASACVYHDQRAVVLLARDITAQLRYERDLHALALIDELTGLQNRRGFTLFAEQELSRARRHGRTPILVFADLDGLKQINDAHGHAAGDAALRLTARALRSILRETDIVARWSGDEFVALMGEGGESAAESIGERLDAALAALAPEGQGYSITASVGTTPLDSDLPLAEAMERADAGLYEQKRRERRSEAGMTPVPAHPVRSMTVR